MFLYPRVMVASEQDTFEEGNSTEKKNEDMAEVFSGNSVFEGKSGIVEVIKGII